MYQVCDWYTHEVIAEFDAEDEREYWLEENCQWFSDGCYMESTGNKVYCQRS